LQAGAKADIPFGVKSALQAAIDKAREFVGATAPNPPVGAVALDAQGQALSIQAHERAGTGHAEAKVIADLRQRGLLEQVHTLFVTLEPCNHQGRTPPCVDAILGAGIRHVVYGARDPNPRVAGQGADRLRAAGVDVRELSAHEADSEEAALAQACRELIQPFAHWALTGRPWVVVKTAHQAAPPSTSRESLLDSMIPPLGQKTFTSPSSLRLAHELRRRADAILTGSGTVLADHPAFTIRHVEDHAIVVQGLKKRRLVILDRRGRVSKDWIQDSEQRGFEVWVRHDLEQALNELGKAGALEVLVEAGPELSSFILESPLWNQHVLITLGNPPGSPDTIKNVYRHHSERRSHHSH
jgi:diaminohydroxyphosphoribosylaminopyrimidine deaminase/5-amino-6-(5-phosphoribosylamino)uracil reductase